MHSIHTHRCDSWLIQVYIHGMDTISYDEQKNMCEGDETIKRSIILLMVSKYIMLDREVE